MEDFKKDKNVPISLWTKEDEVIFLVSRKMIKNFKILIAIIMIKSVTYSSFFDYSTSYQDYQAFDVSQCFSYNGDFDFRIKFPYRGSI